MSDWKKHDGGPMPCSKKAIVEIKQLGVDPTTVGYAGQFGCIWEYGGGPSRYDIIEYRIVEAPREPVRTERFVNWYLNSSKEPIGGGSWTSRDECALNKYCTEEQIFIGLEVVVFEDGIPVSSTFERVK